MRQLDDSSGTRSKVVEGSLDGMQMRGFTQHQVPKQAKGQLRSVAPAGVVVEVGPTLKDAIGTCIVIVQNQCMLMYATAVCSSLFVGSLGL